MAVVSDTISNMVNGVSQQPPSLRRSTQAEVIENFHTTLVEGLKKRPPTNYRAKLIMGTLPEAYAHIINRDTSLRFVTAIMDGDLRVFRLSDGSEMTVNFPDGKSYLDCATPRSTFRAVTVADYTFIVNKAKVPALTADTVPNRNPEAMLNVMAGNYSKTYKVTIDGVAKATYTTSATDASTLDTSFIATQLTTQLTTNLGTGWTVTRYQNAVHIENTTGTDFSLSVEDGAAGGAMSGIKDAVDRFSKLPAYGPEGFIVKIAGANNDRADDYYVKLEKSKTGDSQGIWRECAAEGTKNKLDGGTMPHVLVYDFDTEEFTFKRAAWGERIAGDDESNPNPSFVSRAINDVFFYKGRLGFLADENVILSSAENPFQFFRTSVRDALDADAIDLATTNRKVSILKWAIHFNNTLILSSDQTQFELEDDGVLTAKTASITPLSDYAMSGRCAPVPAGTQIFFPTVRNDWSAVWEYAAEDKNTVPSATEATEHVPRYIPSAIVKMTVSPLEDTLVCLSENDPGALYVYRYYWQGRDKVLASWVKWTFTGAVLDAEFLDSTLHLLVQRSDGVYIETINMQPGLTDTGSEFVTYLDQRVDETQVTASYNSTSDVTTFTLPWPASALTMVVNPDASVPGPLLDVVSYSGNTISVQGDHTETRVYIGNTYTSRYRFSTIYARQKNANGTQVAVTDGRLQLLWLKVNFDNTGYFRVVVQPKGTRSFTYEVNGRQLDTSANALDVLALATNGRKVPIMARNEEVTIEIINDLPWPSNFQSAEWEGRLIMRARRV